MKGLKNNTLILVWDWFCAHIADKYEQHEARSMGRLVFEALLNVSATDFVLNRDLRLSESQIVALWKVIKKLNADVPVQYIIGKAWFRELELKVGPGVLIPRSETEELVQWIMDDWGEETTAQNLPLNVWDIGTGSGCIALSLAQEMKNVAVSASDISETALAVAQENARINGLQVNFFQHDILTDALPLQKYHYIVSNPPYVRELEKSLMQNNVLDHEPHSALFVPDHDPLIFYRVIAQTAQILLLPGGCLYVEINEALGKETTSLFEENGLIDVEIRQDIHGKNRFVKGVKS